ncbi:MAG: 5-deoxyadenosylcobinamide phosphate nucleotidyltransferase [Methanocalculus sp. MSAO_Arc2]|uniref:NTP transferase domain-containing protein n=1 Tax=Methanocalculus sp. MSAO_Arc2 TaxID=2293855 RepID=UPI000FF2D1C4|nr:MAG: 5-deoxyadenosylcobinamide phosphate nucleotidyltransferase [Methanocalculus sp. MSAO_Arc2]
MRVLIMAGGEGSRLNMGEKPLVRIADRPMISWVIDAYRTAGFNPVIVTSERTPYTKNWCRTNDLTFVSTEGLGYLNDLSMAVEVLGEDGAFFISVSDIPCLRAGTIRAIHDAYQDSGMDACSTWVPLSLCNEYGTEPRYQLDVDGIPASPAGINIMNGSRMHQEQEELKLLLHEPGLVFNVNTRSELALLHDHFHQVMDRHHRVV